MNIIKQLEKITEEMGELEVKIRNLREKLRKLPLEGYDAGEVKKEALRLIGNSWMRLQDARIKLEN